MIISRKILGLFTTGTSLFILLSLSCSPVAPTPNSLESAQEPHALRRGPWFEGWYARATNLNGTGSLAVIVGSHVAEGSRPQPGDLMPGYIGILQSDGDRDGREAESPTRSWTFFPKATTITKNGRAVDQDPNLLDPNDAPFQWESQDPGIVARFENNQLFISVPGELEVEMDFQDGKSWDQPRTSPWAPLPLGPEGYLAGLPVPLHWYVKSLNSSGSYKFKSWDADGKETEIKAESSVHLEKNWGQVFPKAWNWLQAHSSEDDAQIVLGGGIVDLASAYDLTKQLTQKLPKGLNALDLTAWLGGYRSPKESWNLRFSDPGTQISVTEDSCSGFFKMIARRPDLEVEIEAQAPRNSFGPVAVPTASGFVADFGVESFSSTISIKTYRKGLFTKKLTDSRVFRNGALEFGAASYHKTCP